MPLFKGKQKKARNVSDPDEFRAPLGEHLEELRTRILRIIGLLIVGWVAGWFLQPFFYSYLDAMIERAVVGVVGEGKYSEAFRNATEAFMLKMRLSFLIGVVMTFPLIVLQIWGFIEPGLKPSERAPFRRLGPLSLFLFAMGAGFCWLILPATISWFAGFIGDFNADLIQEPGSMVFFVLKMMLAFGIGFQLPLVVFALGALGLLTAETLLQYWRQAATLIVLASALITPSGDAFTLLMMSVPLIVLFTISIYAVKLMQRKREKAAAAEEAAEEAEEWEDEPVS